jgi:hypothetical protein
MSEQDTQVQGSGDDTGSEVELLDISEAVDFETLRAPAAKSDGGQPAPETDGAETPSPDEAEAAQAQPSADQQSPESTPASDDETAKYLAQFPTFSYKADGKEHEVPGAHVADNGVFFTPQAMQWLRDQLATAHAHNGSWQRELAKAKRLGLDEGQRSAQAVARQADAKAKAADVITSKMMELAEQGEEAAWEWFQNFRANLPRLLAEAERAQTKAERDELEQEKQERRTGELKTQQTAAFDHLLREYATKFEGVDVARVRARLERQWDAMFPVDEKTGEALVNYGLIEDEFQYAAELLGDARTVRASASKATATGQQNAAAVQPSSAPPAVAPRAGARGKPTSGGMQGRKFKTREEFEAYLASGKADAEALEMLKTLG